MGKTRFLFTIAFLMAAQVTEGAEPWGGTLVWPCGGDLFESCPVVLSELNQRFRKEVFEPAVEGAYLGKIHSRAPGDLPGAGSSEARLAEVPICSLQPLPVNQCREETETNRRTEKCATWSELHYLDPPQALHTLRNTRGHRETAWAAGVFVSALQEGALRIQNEISENRFSLETTSPCAIPASDWHRLLQRVRASEVVGTLRGCRDKGLASCTTGNQMGAVLEGLRTAYLQIVRCRLMGEAMKIQREFGREFLNQVERNAVLPCTQTGQGNPESLQRCYQGRMLRWMGDDLKKRFPLSAAGCLGGAP